MDMDTDMVIMVMATMDITDDEIEVPLLRKITNKIFSKWWRKKK